MVFLLARRSSESPFGNALEMLFVMTLAGGAAVGYGCVALWKWRTGRGHPVPWLLAAFVSLSPMAYFVLWNVFFRRSG